MVAWKLFDKISGPYIRSTSPGPDRNKLIVGEWANYEFDCLQDTLWHWSLKMDGINIRVNWDGHRVSFGGRTESAAIDSRLVNALNDMFPEEILEGVFGSSPFTLFGEGYGSKLNGGGNYRKDPSFILFDVFSYGEDHQLYLLPEDVDDIGKKLGVEVVPFIGWMTPKLAIESVRKGDFVTPYVKARFPSVETHEGIVGRPLGGLLNRKGERIAMKVKVKDNYTEDIE